MSDVADQLAERTPGRFTATTGDPGARPAPIWDYIVREHSERVYQLAYRLSGNPHDADDLTQDTFIRVFRSLPSYRAGNFEGWLRRITANLFLDLVRHRRRLRMQPLPDDTAAVLADGPDPEQAHIQTCLDPALCAALDALNPDFRDVVVLRDIEDRSYEDISAMLGVKPPTVRTRVRRGRLELRASLFHSHLRAGPASDLCIRCMRPRQFCICPTSADQPVDVSRAALTP